MAVTVKKAVLWRRELENRPGTLAETLKPFADGKINLQVVMGYAFPGEPQRSAVEVYPVSGKGETAAQEAGLHAGSEVPCLLVEGEDQVGFAYQVSKAVSDAGINISFAVIQVVARRYQGIFGFESESDAERATALIKSVSKSMPRKSPARKKAAASRTAKGKKTTAGKAGGRKTTAKKAGAARKPAKKTTAKKTARKAPARKATKKASKRRR